MVRVVYISKDKSYIISPIKIISIEEHVDKLNNDESKDDESKDDESKDDESKDDEFNDSDCFEDYTSNFEDLNIWNTKSYHQKPLSIVKSKINEILKDLLINYKIGDGLTLGFRENGTFSNWWWGHTNTVYNDKEKAYGKHYFNLQDNERIEILLFHLSQMLELLNNYDNDNYLIVN